MSRFSPEVRAAVLADYAAGMTTLQAAEKHGVPKTTVHRWVNAAGISRGLGSRAKPCTVDGCHEKHAARGYCLRHYGQLVRHPNATRRNPPIHLEDVEWLAETGETWDNAIERLGVKEKTLQAHLERAGRLDLAHKLKRRGAVA